MSQQQSGECAFSNACTNPGPRQYLPGTNRRFCPVHLHQMEEAVAQPSPAVGGFSSGAYLGPRRRSWATYGLTEGGW